MAVGALGVVRLESAGVVGAGSEVEIVVAGAAGCATGFRHEGFGLRRTGGLAVANLATLGIGGIDDRREVVYGIHVTDNFIGSRRNGCRTGRVPKDAGQLRSHVELMRKH